MKLFGSGNGKPGKNRTTEDRSANYRTAPKRASQQEALKAFLLLISSLFVLVSVLVMCISLISKSAGSDKVSFLPQSNKLRYEINVTPPTSPPEDVLAGLTAPESVHGASVLNILIGFCADSSDSMDAIMLANIDLENRNAALLSIPRDTYISGNYELPKVSQVYHEAGAGERGAEALKEKVKEMIGFWPDYYLIFNDDALSLLVEQAGGSIDFDMDSGPAYSDLPSGTKTITEKNAMKVFQYNSDYSDVETDPARVQRAFLQTLLSQQLKTSTDLSADTVALHELLNTDLSVSDLTYIAQLLKSVDIMTIFSRALPGGEIDVEDVPYYQVDIEEAVAMLNERFNPLEDELTIYDVNFRQLTGDSGDGEFSEYGFHNNNGSTEAPTEDDSEDTTDQPPEESTTPVEETQNTEAPTDPPATDPTETP